MSKPKVHKFIMGVVEREIADAYLRNYSLATEFLSNGKVTLESEPAITGPQFVVFMNSKGKQFRRKQKESICKDFGGFIAGYRTAVRERTR